MQHNSSNRTEVNVATTRQRVFLNSFPDMDDNGDVPENNSFSSDTGRDFQNVTSSKNISCFSVT